MEKQKINPERITKPIQLLGAWLVGLLSIDAAFLLAATNLEQTTWQSGALTVAAIINVPLFIGALFLLQTKFRPELQEDSYYSSYLNNRTNEVVKIPAKDAQIEHLLSKINRLELQLMPPTKDNEQVIELSSLKFGINEWLKNVSDIESKLSSFGVSYTSTFGADSEQPEVLSVAVAEHLPKNVIDKVLTISKTLGFSHFNYIEPWEEIREDVLFGAYGKPAGKIT
ncbi:hypothetical protein ACP1UU_004444 [Vibrio alginolyticus]|uniref:hypothetical protein n=1 Tax=Vibrio diabolicus TaxID=50719 RepID=UPI003753304B